MSLGFTPRRRQEAYLAGKSGNRPDAVVSLRGRDVPGERRPVPFFEGMIPLVSDTFMCVYWEA